MIRPVLALAVCGLLANCTHVITNPVTGQPDGWVYDGLFGGFFVVKHDKDSTVLGQSGMLPTYNGASGLMSSSLAVDAAAGK